MPNNPLVYNSTRDHYLSFKQARKAVENCAAAWVEYKVSVRELTLKEAIAARNAQAERREPPALIEIPGIVYQPPVHAQASTRQSQRLVGEANAFFASALASA